jgi:hypothetical protein
VSDPVLDEKEWVEIYNNSTTTIDLKDWELHEGIKDSTSTKKILSLNNTLEPNSFLVITLSSSRLNNEGDLIALYDSSLNVVDKVVYGNWVDENVSDNAPATSDPNAIARIVDGQNTGNNKNDFAITTEKTPGESNIIKGPEIPVSSGGGGGSSIPTITKSYNPRDIVINELVSDPADGEEEFVEIYNNTSETIDLTNWKISDGSEADTNLVGEIKAHNFFVVEKPKGSLNNAGDLVLLTDPSGKEIDKVVYGSWDDGNTYDNTKKYLMSSFPR